MIIITLATTILASLVGLGFFIYYMKKGQFDESEEVKYQLFHDDEDGF